MPDRITAADLAALKRAFKEQASPVQIPSEALVDRARHCPVLSAAVIVSGRGLPWQIALEQAALQLSKDRESLLQQLVDARSIRPNPPLVVLAASADPKT